MRIRGPMGRVPGGPGAARAAGAADRVRSRVDRRTPERRRTLRGRLGGISVIAAMTAGSWVGFGLGLAIGAVLGALLCWFADAALRWQHDLGLTLGVAQNLLPLGDQVPTLETISRDWYIVVPLAAFIAGLMWAIVGGLVAGLVAAGYNRASRHAVVLVEVPESELLALAERSTLGDRLAAFAGAQDSSGEPLDPAVSRGQMALALPDEEGEHAAHDGPRLHAVSPEDVEREARAS